MELTKLSKGLVSSTDTFTFANVTITGNITAASFNYANGTSILSNVSAGGSSTLAGLTDVNISGTPTTGYVLKWNGTKWAPAVDSTGGGGGGGGASSATVAGYALVFGGF